VTTSSDPLTVVHRALMGAAADKTDPASELVRDWARGDAEQVVAALNEAGLLANPEALRQIGEEGTV
jgi:hypothetical protein